MIRSNSMEDAMKVVPVVVLLGLLIPAVGGCADMSSESAHGVAIKSMDFTVEQGLRSWQGVFDVTELPGRAPRDGRSQVAPLRAQARALLPRFADDTGEIVVPFLCIRNGTQQGMRAVIFDASTSEWHGGAVSAGLRQEIQESTLPLTERLRKAQTRTVSGSLPQPVLWIERNARPGEQSHFEVFYSQGSEAAQLTHYNIPDTPMRGLRVSADGLRALVQIGDRLGIMDLPSGKSSLVPMPSRALQRCSVS